MGVKMLNENQVVSLVCKYLKANGYEIEQSLSTNDKGYDIVAKSSIGKVLIIEAKGATSSRPSSRRYNKEFDGRQVVNHVSRALYSTVKVINSYSEYDVGIALPYNALHIKAVKNIQNVLNTLSINVYWVEENGEVFINSKKM